MNHWQVTVNPGFQVQESDFSNNVVRCDIRYTGSYVQAYNCRITGWVLKKTIESEVSLSHFNGVYLFHRYWSGLLHPNLQWCSELKYSKKQNHIFMDRLTINLTYFYLFKCMIYADTLLVIDIFSKCLICTNNAILCFFLLTFCNLKKYSITSYIY